MPTYEYECRKCRHNFEVFQAMSDEPIKTCPKCGKEVRRLIFGGAGVIFKGSGFYVTDKSAPKTAVSKPSKQSGKSGEKSTGGESPAADARPATPTDNNAGTPCAKCKNADKCA